MSGVIWKGIAKPGIQHWEGCPAP